MPKHQLPPDATIRDLVSSHYKFREFTIGVMDTMRTLARKHGPVAVRIGVVGAGKLPNFRIDTQEGQQQLGAYDGVSFKRFEVASRDGNWSTQAMTFDEVVAVLVDNPSSPPA